MDLKKEARTGRAGEAFRSMLLTGPSLSVYKAFFLVSS